MEVRGAKEYLQLPTLLLEVCNLPSLTGNQMGFTWAVGSSLRGPLFAELSATGADLHAEPRPFEAPENEKAAYAQAAFEPLTVIAGAMGLMILVERVAAFVSDLRHDGLIIDVRRDPIDVRPHPSLDRGVVLVVTDHGVEHFKASNHPDLVAPITAFLKK